LPDGPNHFKAGLLAGRTLKHSHSAGQWTLQVPRHQGGPLGISATLQQVEQS